MTRMTERFISFCRSRRATVLIALFEIIISLYVTVTTSRLLNDTLTSLMYHTDTSIITEPIIKLTVASFGLVFAILLLDGVLRHIPAIIKVWFVWAVVALFFIVLKLNWLLLHEKEKDILESMQYGILLLFRLMGLFVVRMHLLDIGRDKYRDKYVAVKLEEPVRNAE